ncbi:hypothetical protein IW261DRAFT_1469830 [Armillaria novae-zelandiae]|uniref:Uncharacterized protein n=1 Tax=Armillaria novae-zelandiae TaxID=153914 RepID=A0AA39TD71_9AGAR|nr:hypothetical protein IW261DRAFT_1469830 [Armillaria novae-zelandiae]
MRGRLGQTMPAVPTADLNGKRLVLIVANTELGFEAAIYFAWMNPARLTLTPRDDVKENQALDRAFSWLPDLLAWLIIVIIKPILAITGQISSIAVAHLLIGKSRNWSDWILVDTGVATSGGWETYVRTSFPLDYWLFV